VIDNVPQHADLARRALQARAGHSVRFTVADADEATDLVMAMVHGHG
jgi:2-phospho-L-lactate guanylyltransferase (CobY/MobA/RfbA family)